MILEELTAAPVPLLVNGKHYSISPLTQGDFGSLLRTFQFYQFNTLKGLPDVNENLLQETLKKCLASCPTLQSNDFNNWTASEAGMTEALFLSLAKKKPEITREEIRDWNPNQCQLAFQILVAISTGINMEDTQKKIQELRERFPNLLPISNG